MKTTKLIAKDAAGNKYRWSYWRENGLWFLKDHTGYVRILETNWERSVPRIRTIP